MTDLEDRLARLSPAQREKLARMLQQRARGETPLQPRRSEQPLPLSDPQRAIFLTEQANPGTAWFHMHEVFRVHGPLDTDALDRALSALIRRHDALRIAIVAGPKSEAMQVALHEEQHAHVLDLRSEADARAAAKRTLRSEATARFEHGRPLFRARVLRVAEEEHLLSLTMHHIISDGWSAAVLLRDLSELYRAELERRAPALPERELEYLDWIAWRTAWSSSREADASYAYWRAHLREHPRVPCPVERPVPEPRTFRTARIPLAVPAGVHRALKSLARREGTSLFGVLLAGLAVTLSQWTGVRLARIGTVVANRTRPGVEHLCGLFSNFVILSVKTAGDVRSTIPAARAALEAALAHQELPYETLERRLRQDGEPLETSTIDVTFTFENIPFGAFALGDASTEPATERDDESAPLSVTDLHFELRETRDGALEGALRYQCELFSEQTAERIARGFEQSLRELENPHDAR